MPQVRVLSCHAEYRCRHAGACCTSNWPIPIEADRLLRLRTAIASGHVRPAAGSDAGALIQPGQTAESADIAALLGRNSGTCVFYDASPAGRSGRCRIHVALGHDALPLACRQFPRVSVLDPRGVSVTLSHYCPTAAAKIDTDRAPLRTGIEIKMDAPAFSPSAEYVGLDARAALPPLARRDMLMDWDAWWESERLAIALFDADISVGMALSRLRAAVADIQAWSPPDGSLIDRVREAFARHRSTSASTDSARNSRLVEAVFAAIPAELRPARFDAATLTREHVTRRYLAAHAFANWSVHLGNGLEAWVGSVEAACALLDAGAGVRHADLLLRHLVDPGELASAVAGGL